MKKLLLIFALLFWASSDVEAQYIERANCTLYATPIANATTCKQTTTAGGLTAGHLYNWNGSAWEDISSTGGAAPTDATYITRTSNATLSAEQALGDLGTGILKNTTTTGVPSIAVAADFPTLNQNTTGTAAALTTNPTDCAAGAYAKSIAASGNLGCDILIVYASVDPTVNDDTGDGIIKGTKWHNDQGDADPTNDTIWEAVSITAADALWVQIYPAPGSVTPTLSSVLAAGNSYFGATSPSTGLILGEDANNYGVIYWDLSTGGPKLICVVAGVPRNCNIEYTLNAGYSFKLNDSAGAPAFEYKEGVGVTRLIPGTIAQGDIYFHDGTKITRLAPGSAGECLKSQGAGANPQWTTC